MAGYKTNSLGFFFSDCIKVVTSSMLNSTVLVNPNLSFMVSTDKTRRSVEHGTRALTALS